MSNLSEDRFKAIEAGGFSISDLENYIERKEDPGLDAQCKEHAAKVYEAQGKYDLSGWEVRPFNPRMPGVVRLQHKKLKSTKLVYTYSEEVYGDTDFVPYWCAEAGNYNGEDKEHPKEALESLLEVWEGAEVQARVFSKFVREAVEGMVEDRYEA